MKCTSLPLHRRKFITLLGGAAWPVAARAQQVEGVRRVGILNAGEAPDSPDVQARIGAFVQEMHRLGWIDGRNLRIDQRAGLGNSDNLRKYAVELVALQSEIILSNGTPAVAALLQATRSVPIVFAAVADPVGAGFVDSLARPGGNTTGFISLEYGLSAKWIELLKEIAPGTTRAAVLRDPTITAGIGQFAAIQTAAPSLGVEVSPINVRDPGEIADAVMAFARSANGGLIVTGGPLTAFHHELIVTLAARYKLPAVYANRFYVAAGGLICYGPDPIDPHRRAADYVDRILKGEKPADLPVQAPTRYKMAIDLRTAKELGLEIPASLLARADEVIE